MLIRPPNIARYSSAKHDKKSILRAGEKQMRGIRIVLLCLAVVAFSLPAMAQQSDSPGAPAATGFKAKFKEKRAKFVSRMKTIYFAAGCKILDNEARAGLVDAEAARVFVRQKADPKVDDLKKEAEQDGLARASRPGECDYFLKNPQAAEAIRKAAREAKEAALKR
jgi:hypothetical protein